MKKLVIIGAGGFGREVAWMIERINSIEKKWDFLGFIDDNKALQGKEVDGYKVLGDCSFVKDNEEIYYVCAVAASKTRRVIISKIEKLCPNIKYATIVDPSVIKSNTVKIGKGTIICGGFILTVNIKMGNHNIINWGSIVGHDAVLEDYVTLYPSVNISGSTHIGECVEMGTGMQIIQGKSIGEETIVGAGAVVVKDLPKKCTAVGVPAKVIRYTDEK